MCAGNARQTTMEPGFAKLNHWKKIPSRLQPLPLDPRKCAALNPKFPKQMHTAQASNTKAAEAEGCAGGGAARPGLAATPLRDQPQWWLDDRRNRAKTRLGATR